MKRIFYFILFLMWPGFILAQDPDGNYNPYVNGGIISPSPLLPLEVNGSGVINFNIGNTGSDPLEVYTDQYITLTITLSYVEPDNTDPLAAISGSSAGLFSWTYNSGTYSAIQTSTIPANSSGAISIDFLVNQNSISPGSNGFNVNITPAAYQTASNTQNDDAVSSYTYTELNDYGDAPESYGSAPHNLDFENYLGSLVDGESGPQYSASANGDDLNGEDDEDGVIIPAEINREDTIIIPVTVTGLGRINAWFDWNGDGDFEDTGEQVADNIAGFDGTVNLTVPVPADAIISDATFARFRFSPSSLSSPTESVSGGEAEDYQITILCAPPTPSLIISDSDSSFCNGTEISFTAGGGINYDFRVNGSIVQSGASTVYTTTELTDQQVVDVIVTDTIGCSAISEGITSTVLPQPLAGITSSDTDNAFCLGTTIIYTANGGVNYDFRINENSIQNGTDPTFTINTLEDGQIVDVLVTDSNGCQAVSDAISNTVYDLPTATLTSSDADSTFCEGSSISFTATGGVNYDFRIDGTSVQNGSLAVFTTTEITNGQGVDVVVSDSNACSDTSGIIFNTVESLPIADAGEVLTEICQGESSVNLGGSISGSATGVYWSSDAGGSFSPDTADLDAIWTPPAGYSGTATLTLTTTGGNCGNASSSKTQLVNPLPTLNINDPDPVCSPETVDLTDPAITLGSTADLSFSYWLDVSATQPYTTPDMATDGIYYIMGTSTSSSCSVIAPIVVTVNPTPETPEVIVTDNCDGTSVLSTTATGILEWSTGETTSSIIVSIADVYSVTTTVDACVSAPGTGTASPHTAPSPPEVSDPAAVNVCPETSVDLTNLITSSTPAGGSVLYKTVNDPLGADLSDPTAAETGSYYIFYQDQNGCYSTGTEVSVSIETCPPDLTPTLIVSPNIMHGATSFDLTVRISELNNISTSGQIIIHIPKDSRWNMPDGFDTGLSIIGTTPLNNSDWTFSEDAINHIFTSSAVITAGNYSTIGFRVSFDPGSTRGIYTITAQLVSGGGGETRVSNNADSERIDYFQE